jgi:hypothetical protein
VQAGGTQTRKVRIPGSDTIGNPDGVTVTIWELVWYVTTYVVGITVLFGGGFLAWRYFTETPPEAPMLAWLIPGCPPGTVQDHFFGDSSSTTATTSTLICLAPDQTEETDIEVSRFVDEADAQDSIRKALARDAVGHDSGWLPPAPYDEYVRRSVDSDPGECVRFSLVPLACHVGDAIYVRRGLIVVSVRTEVAAHIDRRAPVTVLEMCGPQPPTLRAGASERDFRAQQAAEVDWEKCVALASSDYSRALSLIRIIGNAEWARNEGLISDMLMRAANAQP